MKIKIIIIALILALAIPAAATFFDLKKGVSMGDSLSLSGGLQIMRSAAGYEDGDSVIFNTDTVVTFNGDGVVIW